MVDCEDQFQRKKRSLSWSLSPFTALTVRATLSCAMVMPPMANSSIAAARADGKAARIPLPMPIQKRAARRSCMQAQERSSLRGLTRTDRGFRVPPSQVGSKKSSSASAFVDHSARSGSRRSHVHHPGTLSALVVCAQKSARLLDVDGPLPPDATGGGLCDWGSEPARRVSGCGKPFQRGIARGIASPISGRPTRR